MTLKKCLLNVLNTSALQLGHKSPTLHFLDNVLFIGYLFLITSINFLRQASSALSYDSVVSLYTASGSA